MGIIVGIGNGLFAGGGGGRDVERFSASAEYIRRKAGGSDAIASGKAIITKMKGKTIVWNQMVDDPNCSRTSNYNRQNITITSDDGFGEAVLAGNVGTICPHMSEIHLYSSNYGINGHKYLHLVKVKCISGEASARIGEINAAGVARSRYVSAYTVLSNTWKQLTFITPENVNSQYYYFSALEINKGESQEDATIQFKGYMVFDLTNMFGAGNEPATVDEFEAMFPLPYYEHNEGTLINNKASAIETVGFNQWDEEWEVGYYYRAQDGVKIHSSRDITSTNKNAIKVFPETQYMLKPTAAESGAIFIVFFDAQNQYIGYASVNATGGVFTTPANARYAHFNISTTFIDAGNKVCINLSNSALNGQYKPYWKNDLQLNLSTLTGKLNGQGSSVVVFPDGLRSVGSVYDEIVGNRAIKRIGSVDVGTIDNFTITQSGLFLRTGFALDFNAKPNSDSNRPSNILLAGYITVGASPISGTDTNKEIALHYSGGNLYINTAGQYTTIDSFETGMSGATLYYELAEPEEYILDAPLPKKYKVDANGTEERLPADTASSVAAPISYDVEYPKPKE